MQPSEFPNLFFIHVADGEEDLPEGLLLDSVQKITLIFVWIGPFEEAGVWVETAVVPRCKEVGAESELFFKESFELDLRRGHTASLITTI